MLTGLVLLAFVSQIHCSVEVCDKKSSRDISDFSANISDVGVINAEGILYAKNEYYVDPSSGSLRGCDLCKKESAVCIRKCCSFGYGYNPITKVCVSVNEGLSAIVKNGEALEKGKAVDIFTFVTGKHNCSDTQMRLSIEQIADISHIHENGSLIATSTIQRTLQIFGPDEYCIDTFVGADNSTHLGALVCFSPDHDDETETEQYVQSSACMLISCVFILITCAVYAFLPELRNLHGKVLMANLLCFFVGFSLMATMQILLKLDQIPANMCVVMSFGIYFSILSAFFWLNVMCFDIWWTFSGKRGLSLEKLSNQGRFLAYAAYAFGFPTMLTILLAVLEFSDLPPHPWLPWLRDRGCFLAYEGKYIYFYSPMLILCCSNLIFFILTAAKIAQINKQTSVLKSRESSTHDPHRNDKQRLVLYIKLFLVTGVNWIFELVTSKYNEQWFFRLVDAYNVLLGVIIFFIFVCKRKIFQLVKKRIKDKFQRSDSGVSDLKKFDHLSKRFHNCGPRYSVDSQRTTVYSVSESSLKEDKISKF